MRADPRGSRVRLPAVPHPAEHPVHRRREPRLQPMSEERIERDSMGEVRVPADARWGAQTQRAVENFPISGLRLERSLIEALARIKAAVASVKRAEGMQDAGVADVIVAAADEVARGDHDLQFPIDVFQTGSGTSSNMNMNEVV